jgi:hypothetical protein
MRSRCGAGVLAAAVLLSAALLLAAATAAATATTTAAATTAAATAAAATPAAATTGVDETCELSLVRVDPNVVNVAYPDAAAIYYGVAYAGAPGTRIEVDGIYPHARYMSWTAYDPELRPIAALNDLHIAPAAGSADPFVVGAARNTPVTRRHYRLFIDFGAAPADPAPNTIYTGNGENGTPNLAGTILYRIYMPDSGDDASGGVGLPVTTLEPTTVTQGTTPSSPCSSNQSPASALNANAVLQLADGVPAIEAQTHGVYGTDPAHWQKFVNVAYSLSQLALTSPDLQITAPLDGPLDSATMKAGGSGGFLSNLDNAYVASPISRSYGQVLVVRMRVPTFPDTRGGATTMPGGQVRYWSLCENDPFTERYVACDTDDQTTQSPRGYATYVVSTPAQRPANATTQCGVNWLPWGPDLEGLLILRNMLPEASFTQSVQDAAVGKEAATMGAYLPADRYTSTASFAALGCAGAAEAIAEADPTAAGASPARPTTARCPAATGTLSGTHLGLIQLGMTRARVHRRFAAVSTRGRRYEDFFCLSPRGVRSGYASPRLLASLPRARRATYRGRVVWASTASPFYTLDGVRVGERLRAAERVLPGGRRFRVGLNQWYLARAGASTAVLKVRAGVVQEIGIADAALTRTAAGDRVLLRSFS